MTKDETDRVLAEAVRLIDEGKVVIANDAFSKTQSSGMDAATVSNIATGGLFIQWCRDGEGFGGFTLRAENGQLVADTEGMGDEFVLDVLAQLLRERRP